MKLKVKMVSVIRKLGGVIPVKKNLWVFGAWQGNLYSDNSKYLFEYISTSKKNIRAVWITRNKKVYDDLKGRGYVCYMHNSYMGIYCALRAEVAFETSGNEDISPLILDTKTKVMMLWHGIGVKALKWEHTSFGKECSKFKHHSFPATSELYVDVISQLMNVSKDQFRITGYARNDTFIHKPKCEHLEQLKKRYKDCRFLIYMPTHRNFGKSGNSHINIDEFKKVDEFLCNNQLIMVYKPHYHELAHFLEFEKSFTNIIFAKEDIWADPYSYLHYFDIMISDYSSCIFDFLCSGKPVVLFPYDIESYKNQDAGLLDIYWSIPAGPMCYTWDEVLNMCIELLMNDTWKSAREKCRLAYHFYNDGENCRRIYEYTKAICELQKA